MEDTKLTGPWSLRQVEDFLEATVIPVRLSVITRSGWPLVVSLWFLYENGRLKCASRKFAKVVKALEGNPRCGFEIAGETPPYFGIRGRGMASLVPEEGEDVLRRLADRYLGTEDTPFRRWLLAGAADETAIVIAPERLMSWDYRSRMPQADPDN